MEGLLSLEEDDEDDEDDDDAVVVGLGEVWCRWSW